jgi:hypothetical protein
VFSWRRAQLVRLQEVGASRVFVRASVANFNNSGSDPLAGVVWSLRVIFRG